METETIRVSGIVAAAPQRVFNAWLDSDEHSRFTGGGAATVEPGVGGRFSAWGGYIEGRTLEIDPGRRIVQSWRSTDFPAGHPDSRLEVLFEPEGDAQTRVTFVHSAIPAGQSEQYEEGWREHYLQPMSSYFGDNAPDGESDSPFADVAAAARQMMASAEEAVLDAEATVEKRVRAAATKAVRGARKAVAGARKKLKKTLQKNVAKPAKKMKAKAAKAVRAQSAKARKSVKKAVAKLKRPAAKVKQTARKTAKKIAPVKSKKKTKPKK